MRRPIIAYMDNGLPVRLLSRRDFLLPDADEKYVPAVPAYIRDTDVDTLNTLLRTRTPGGNRCDVPLSLGPGKKVCLPGLVRLVGGTAGGRGEADAAAAHGMDGAAKVQRSRRGRSVV
jgi:hypothetical protein